MFIGMQCVGLLIPIVYGKTARACRQAESLDDTTNGQVKFNPELRLCIWSAILAAFLFGFGITGVFIPTYLFIIDSYEVYSASALTFVSLVRYFAAGGMTVVRIPWYENMGVSHTLTILACISVLLVPIPYLLYFYGHHLRAKSKYAVSWE
ncbi:hypothetical protein CDV31_007048 [Fusarium ambrosium]|uniref:Major facilitator superfamily (MFS) profile domain-containing protein n=1 Tax=Fusarium ambrosium TaxID=131363 RepID=A0A428U9G2_9HYPO|nr:hypothetical protein CDV31_007048 [Fusarium ambrosium]